MVATAAKKQTPGLNSNELAAITTTVEKLRVKLLDLSLRNPLLNFRFTKRTLRIIDELPDQLFSGLVDGKSFSFSPLPEPTREELDQWVRKHGQSSETEDGEPEFRLEAPDAKPDRKKASRTDISRKEWAKEKGIEPEYDLPKDPGASRRRSVHRDQKLQTFEWHDTLESSVRKLAQDARTAINETGSNMLFLGFGFLEWKETRESKAQLAPLLLLPVELVRPEVRRGPRAYRLQANGDDIQINLALRKKLEQDFGIAIPDFDEESGVEDYFDKVVEALGDNRDWVVRRQIYLSLVSQLGRLLLYNDLDPANWPGGGVFAKSELVRTLLGAMTDSAVPTGSISYEVSKETIAQELELPLIDRADSSQLEAIRLILEGKNLVIQGPPGTGKSQTITNLIAALISQGKTVLFVAEKLAALQVVERRLSNLGFDPYCLELHSHKTQKKALLEALKLRAESRAPQVPKDLAKLQDRAKAIRKSLNTYVEAVGAEAPDGNSVADLLLSAGHHTLSVGDVVKTIDRLRLPERVAKGLSKLKDGPIDVEGREYLLAELAQAANEISTVEPVLKSPWYGVSRLNLLESDRATIEGQLEDLESALTSFGNFISQLEKDQGLNLSSTDAERVHEMCDASKLLKTARPRIGGNLETLSAELERLGLRQPSSWKMMRLLIELQSLAKSAPLSWIEFSRPEMDAPDAADHVERLANETEDLSAAFSNAELYLPRAGHCHLTSAELIVHSASFSSVGFIARPFSKTWKAAKSAVLSLGGEFNSAKADVWSQRFVELAELLQRRDAVASDKSAIRIFGQLFDGVDTDFEALNSILNWRSGVRESLSGDADSDHLADWLLQQDFRSLERLIQIDVAHWKGELDWALSISDDRILKSAKSDIWTSIVDVLAPDEVRPILLAEDDQSLDEAFAMLDSLGSSTRTLIAAQAVLKHSLGLPEDAPNVSIEEQLALVQRQIADLDGLPAWVRYARHRKAAFDLATQPLIQAAEEGYPIFSDLPAVWRYCAYRSAAQSIFKNVPALHEKNGSERNQERRAFRRLDEEIMEARRSEIAAKVHARKPPYGYSSSRVGDLTELALLAHQWGLQRPRISIRNLMHRSGRAVQALKPCFMMGPLSVAQYLKPGGLEFDVIIMDEASQMRPEDALSAVARGKQLVVVGDDKQLPPTNFFNRVGSDGDGTEDYDEEVIGEKEESILSLAASKFDSRMLRWHYRSRHESLIAFSNSWFYDNKLIVYPTPNKESDKTGIDFNYVPEGRFDSGINDQEARAVAKAAVHHMRTRPEQSLIAVAMNSAQRDRIRQYVDEFTKNDVAIVRAEEDSARGEPFDVKNLENVQGDERDVVLLSMTYGPSPETGKVYQRFGPINLEHGHRRLNVLFSRARERMIVFSSMKSSDVLVGENAKLGVKALSGFLEYSETGVLPGRVVPVGSGREPDSDFEISVAQALRARGYDVVAQLGVDGFFLDLAVRDPDAPSTYLMGIECDGASYHSSKSARDRDRLRQDILEGLGWRIERIWSTDWFQEPGRELSRIVEAIEDETSRRRAERHRPTAILREAVQDAPEQDVKDIEDDIQEDDYADPEDNLLDEQPAEQRRMSRREARDVLIRLREDTIKPTMPEVPPEKGLLRKVMLEALLDHLPQDETEFRDMIPLRLREATDADQFATFSKVVFRILRQVD